MKIVRTLVVACALVSVSPLAVGASARHVIVNGTKLTPAQIAVFDQAQCTLIPNGNYWWNPATGAWGYAGNLRVQGYIGQLCRRAGNRGRRKSLSERGLLYTPGDLNFR